MRIRKSMVIQKQVLSVILVMIFAISIPFFSGDEEIISAMEYFPARADGPQVNNSQVDIVLYEGYGQIVAEFFNATGFGTYDLFFDPNYEWNEVPYPNKPFSVQYPSSYTDENTPIKVKIERDPFAPTLFGKVTITENVANWNNIIYGKEWFVVTIIGRNRTGSSTAEVRFKVYNVNDRPEVISDRDFFSIAMDEDTEYIGLNKDHDPPNLIFGDKKDPFDVLTYSYEAVNELATHVSVEIAENGSFIKFTPEEDWACPYVPTDQRLKGPNYKKPENKDYFCHFRINCSDQDGLYVPKDKQNFYVYVGPVNDPPEMMEIGELTFVQDELAVIDLEATDPDLDWDQELIFGTNLTTSVYDRTQEQIEFQDEYVFDKETGHIEFMTYNDLVGTYPVSAYVRDKPTVSGRPDYPVTPYRIWSNFTLIIENINDPPFALIDQPQETFTYNTSSLIEFNAMRSSDKDISFGDVLNFTWRANGEIIGFGPLFFRTIETEGSYNITVNVTDSEGEYSVDWVDINIVKARVPGEIFAGKDIERQYADNNTAVVIRRTTDDLKLMRGGDYGLDIVSIIGKRTGAVYSIRIDFAQELDFYYTSEIQQEPILELYFLKPDFEEQQVEIDPSKAIDFRYPLPQSNVRYKRFEYSLRGPTALGPIEIINLETIRILDSKMGVEITLTVVEMDDLGIRPDFELYAVATMNTVTKDADGQLLEQFRSWDSAGLNTKDPIVTDAFEDENGNGESGGIGFILWIIIFLVIIVLLIVAVVIVILVRGKKDDTQEQPAPVEPEQSLDDMIFGDQEQQPQYPDAQQMYGQNVQQSPDALAGQTEQPATGLPPAEIQKGTDSQDKTVPSQMSEDVMSPSTQDQDVNPSLQQTQQ